MRIWHRRDLRPAALLVVAAISFGCVSRRPRNPVPGMKRIAVAPIIAPQITKPEAGLKIGEILAGELVQFPGVEGVVRPEEIAAVASSERVTLDTPDNLRRVAARAGADAIIRGTLTEYQPYYPPRIGMRIELLGARGGTRAHMWAISLDRGVPAPWENPGGEEGVVFERVYDSSDRSTEIDVWLRELATGNERKGLTRRDWILRVEDNYFRFVSDRLVRELFALLRKRKDVTGLANGGERNPVPHQGS